MASLIAGGKVIPEVLNDYNIYGDDGDKLLGVTGSVTLAALQFMTATISGAGIGGEYATPIVGKTQSIQQEVPFRVFYDDLSKYGDSTKYTGITLRGAAQCREVDTGKIKPCGIRVVIRGSVTTLNPGTVQVGAAMDGSITWEVMYMLYEIDGVKAFEFDKLSNTYVVNGEDVTAPIRRLC